MDNIKKSKKAKKITYPVYTVTNGCALIVQHGYVNDSIGRVSFSTKGDSKIYLESLASDANKDLKTPASPKVNQINSGLSNSIDCFYNLLSQASLDFGTTITGAKSKPTYQLVTGPSINVYNVNLASGINTLEIRNNDLYILKGVDASPFDLLSSLAITNAQVNSIKGLVTDNSVISAITFKIVRYPDIPSTGPYRTYYKARLKIDGSTLGNTKAAKKNDLDTTIDVYSTDKNNWISVDYANAAASKIQYKTVWDNQLVPVPVTGSTNPFGSNWTTLLNKLNSIKSEADALAPTGTGYRLFNTSIRDYIYQGDLDKVTFEMAFRLPFFTENLSTDDNDAPYKTVKATGKFSTPYYTKFNGWFGYANDVRTTAGYSAGKLLSRAGHMQSFTDSIQANPDNLKLYSSIFYVPRNPSFTSLHVPAYMGKVMEDENPYATYLPKSKNIIHFPAVYKFTKTVYKTPDNGATLSDVLTHLESIGKISAANNHATKQALLTGAINSFTTILSPSASNGYYLVKDSATSLFIIHNLSVPDTNNHSGWTVGLGYDIGQHPNYDAFIAYTSFKITDDIDIAIYKEAMGYQRERAAALYESYKTTVIPNYKLPYDTAVQHTIPFMKTFLSDGLNDITGQHYLVVPNGNDFYFFNPNTTQYLNEVEKLIFLSELYNGGGNAYKNTMRDKFLIHALNTHDFRWLKYFADKPKAAGLSTYPDRKEALKKFMLYNSTFNHYDIKQSSL